MTCIIGYIEGKTVHMGGDSCLSWGYYNEGIGNSAKVYRKGEYLIGFAGSCAEGDLMECCFDPPQLKGAVKRFMLETFARSYKQFLAEHGRLLEKDGLQSMDVEALIGVRGRLFWMDGIGGMNELKSPYQSIGCGADFALGAMEVLHGQDLTPKQKILAALKASAKHCSGVAAPFHVKSI